MSILPSQHMRDSPHAAQPSCFPPLQATCASALASVLPWPRPSSFSFRLLPRYIRHALQHFPHTEHSLSSYTTRLCRPAHVRTPPGCRLPPLGLHFPLLSSSMRASPHRPALLAIHLWHSSKAFAAALSQSNMVAHQTACSQGALSSRRVRRQWGRRNMGLREGTIGLQRSSSGICGKTRSGGGHSFIIRADAACMHAWLLCMPLQWLQRCWAGWLQIAQPHNAHSLPPQRRPSHLY